jgi:hypothetical protein
MTWPLSIEYCSTPHRRLPDREIPEAAKDRINVFFENPQNCPVIRDRIGPHMSSPFVYAIALAVFAVPLWWRSSSRRAAVFAIVFLLVAFWAMAVVRYTGSAHHIVLLYPMPHLLVGAVVTALRPRWLAMGVGATLVIGNLLVVNQYISEFERNGLMDYSPMPCVPCRTLWPAWAPARFALSILELRTYDAPSAGQTSNRPCVAHQRAFRQRD